MKDFEFTAHSIDMLVERNIPEELIWRTIRSSDDKQLGADGNIHHFKAIEESNGRILRIIVNENTQPKRIVTAFFDRRLGKRTR